MTWSTLMVGILALTMSTLVYTCSEDGNEGIVAENNIFIPVNIKNSSNMTQAKFNKILDRIDSIYSPIIKSLGKSFVIDRKWRSGKANAYAEQKGQVWRIDMYGGLARHRTITADGFAAVACHEVGHHLGGIPRKKKKGSSKWSSVEGQADYFGVMKCLRKYMEKDDNISIVSKLNVPQIVSNRCSSQFSHENDIAMCKRGAMAGYSLAKFFKDMSQVSNPMKFETPDTSTSHSTDERHPEGQCRLDTYFAAATCEIDHYSDMSSEDETIGVCSRKMGHNIGVRPLCWFKPTNV